MVNFPDPSTFCDWVNRIEYSGPFSLWMKAHTLATLPERCYSHEYDLEKREELDQQIAAFDGSVEESYQLLQTYLYRALSGFVPEEAEFDEFLDDEWFPVSEDFAHQLFAAFIANSPLEFEDDEEGDPFSNKLMFPVSDELYRHYETMRCSLFESYHSEEPFQFFSNIKTLDVSNEYDNHVPSVMGINRSMLFLAWLN
ncbi:MAG: hypothetical protein EP343_00120 [Deltaproteobacteria bacterium]|nr:MAG: hypothetical protein EP343_00120 [Deltaproteobacteria bacterium]